MNTQDLIEAVSNGTFSGSQIVPELINADEIMKVSKLEVLRAIAENADWFEKLSQPQTWPPGVARQRILGRMDVLNSYIRDLNIHACTCTKYQYFSLDPEWESDEGLISIINRSTSKGSSNYDCQCQNCQKTFRVVITLDGMGGDYFLWSQN